MKEPTWAWSAAHCCFSTSTQLLNGEGLGPGIQITNPKAWGAGEHVGGTKSKIPSSTLGWGTMENVGKVLMVDRLSV